MPVGTDGQERDIVIATFYQADEPDDAASKKIGVPQFKMTEMVRITVPGQRDEVCRPVQEQDKLRWAARYEQFRKGIKQEFDGVPISEFATATEAERSTLKAVGIFTVEQAAGLNDDSAQKLHCVALKAKAQAFLKIREGVGQASKLQARIAELEKQVRTLTNANSPPTVPGRDEGNGIQPANSDSVGGEPGQQAVGAARKRGRPRANVAQQVAPTDV
jgi:hypothetical protein